jgi:hypothetical protein
MRADSTLKPSDLQALRDLLFRWRRFTHIPEFRARRFG